MTQPAPSDPALHPALTERQQRLVLGAVAGLSELDRYVLLSGLGTWIGRARAIGDSDLLRVLRDLRVQAYGEG
jgi:hypothetical protein